MAVTSLKRYLKPLAHKTFKKKSFFFLSLSVGFATLMLTLSILNFATIPQTEGKVLGKNTKIQSSISTQAREKPTSTPTLTPITTVSMPTAIPTPTPIQSGPTPTQNPVQVTSPSSQYTGEQIGENTFRVKNVQNDSQMASSNEIFVALNSYRQSRGVGQLSWDSALSDLANSRVNTFASKGDLDSHAGFQDFMNNDGFSKAGFNGLGENSARLSGPMSGDRIIKEIFGADAPHDTNQLNPEWTHAAVAVNGNFVNVNFGKGKR